MAAIFGVGVGVGRRVQGSTALEEWRSALGSEPSAPGSVKADAPDIPTGSFVYLPSEVPLALIFWTPNAMWQLPPALYRAGSSSGASQMQPLPALCTHPGQAPP